VIAPETQAHIDSRPVEKPIRYLGKNRLLRWVEHLLATVGLCFIIYHLGFEITVMTSDSMAPTLQGSSYVTGDRILIEKLTGWFRSPRRWEVYFFYNSEGTPVAKRIVGLPGEKISMKGTRIFVNGKELEIPARLKFLKHYAFGNLTAGRVVDCGEGYFVLGDDSRDSYDSRFLGPVGRQELRGRVCCILWPSDRLGFVN